MLAIKTFDTQQLTNVLYAKELCCHTVILFIHDIGLTQITYTLGPNEDLVFTILHYDSIEVLCKKKIT